MVPLNEYVTVDEDATLYEAVMSLEKVHLAYNNSFYQHRAILIVDKEQKVIGKISQLDVLRALEPKYAEMQGIYGLSRHGLGKAFIKSLMVQYRLFESPMKVICKTAGTKNVRDFMYTPTEGEYVSEDSTLDEAIHLLVVGQHQSLLVTRDEEIVGILRLADVFTAVFQTMKECQI
jgi:CBS domain-containing protein